MFFAGIQKLILAGRIGDAIDTTRTLYPGLLERNPNLLFQLKCRQFVEMISGSDSEVRGPAAHSPTWSNLSSPCSSPGRTLSCATVLSTAASTSNDLVSNGCENGYSIIDDEDEGMEVEDADDAVLNGNSTAADGEQNNTLGMHYFHLYQSQISFLACNFLSCSLNNGVFLTMVPNFCCVLLHYRAEFIGLYQAIRAVSVL